MTHFSDLGLAQPLLKALTAKGYSVPTPIQTLAIPHVLAGRDVLGLATTGTGKTAAFALPMLDRLAKTRRSLDRASCRALVLSPTRELVTQIAASFRAYGQHIGLKVTAIVGGMPFRPQASIMSKGVDVLVATPGRLLDHVDRGTVRLDAVEIFVLDEADHMLDLGFIPAIRALVRHLPKVRQSLFFSATMPKEIGRLADELLRAPQKVSAGRDATPAELIDQQVVFVETSRKSGLLADILQTNKHDRVLVFTRTKRGADKLARTLVASKIGADVIHGNRSQSQRERALDRFRSGHTPVLVATDIAARGIQIDAISLVVNFDLPHVPETYVHRIGRTARAGAAGLAISFCGSEERSQLRAIETLIRSNIPSRSHGGASAARPQHPAEPATRNGNKKRNKHRRAPTIESTGNRAGNGSALAEVPFFKAKGSNGPKSRRRRSRRGTQRSTTHALAYST